MVTRQRPGAGSKVLAIGEAKGGRRPIGPDELERLEHLRELLPADHRVPLPRLLRFARGGFTAELRRAAAGRSDVELVDLQRLYRGD